MNCPNFRLLHHESVIQAARRREVEWVFNPPLASHHGGLWERMIQTIRRVLYAVLHHSSRLSDDVLTTVFCESENLVYSCPITKCSSDASDDESLTPNHLLIMNGNYSHPCGKKHVPTKMAPSATICPFVLETMAQGVSPRVKSQAKMA